MPIFRKIKEYLTARQVAEHYGLKVKRNGMACCPFHDDKHPSMKVDANFYCFGCGAHGDAVGYVAQLFGLSQYDAACRIIEDFNLPIETHPTKDYPEYRKARDEWRRQKEERDRIIIIKERFRRWCSKAMDDLSDSYKAVQEIKECFRSCSPEKVFSSPEYETAVKAEPVIDYWMDILCLGSEEDRQELFIKNRKGVGRIAEELKGAISRVLDGSRTDTGCRREQCG